MRLAVDPRYPAARRGRRGPRGGGGAAATLRNVSTGASILDTISTTNRQQNTVAELIAVTEITVFRARWEGWYVNATEISAGANSTIQASVEYPIGTTPQELLFTGVSVGSLADGSWIECDPKTLSTPIPAGAAYILRVWTTNTVAILTASQRSGTYTWHEAAASGLSPRVGDNTKPVGGTFGFLPSAVMGMATKPALWMPGDSKVRGSTDITTGVRWRGEIERSLNGQVAFCNAGRLGDSLFNVMGQNTGSHFYAKRKAICDAYYTHVHGNLGVNDMGSQTALATKNRLEAFLALLAKPAWWNTVAPKSAGPWDIPANQTVDAKLSDHNAFYNYIVNGQVAGLTGFNDVRSVLSDTSPLSGLWKAGLITNDGIHENQAGYELVASSGVINPAQYV